MEYQCPQCLEKNPQPTGYCRRCGSRLGGGARTRRAVWAVLALAVVGTGLFLMLSRGKDRPPTSADAPPAKGIVSKLRLGIAYGTEKETWLKWAAGEFAKTPACKDVELDLQGRGSLEAAQAVLGGDKTIHVWSPASAMYKDVFLRDWKTRHVGDPIVHEADLLLTPMVFIMWDERYQAFRGKYGEASFRTLAQAIGQEGGWSAIAGQSDWGFFKFGHTHPNKSNSGLATLVLMAYDYHAKHDALATADLTGLGFQQWMAGIERNLVGAANPADQLSHSTGTLMNWMIQRGPSTYDAICVYESVAIERLHAAQGRWGPLKVVYPQFNMWNGNPYYVLDVPWSTPRHRQAANAFLDFLLSEPCQSEALRHGFRPANGGSPLNAPQSPLVQYRGVGLLEDVPGTFCKPPKAEVIENLLLLWQRTLSGR